MATLSFDEFKKKKKNNQDIAPVRSTKTLEDYASEKGATIGYKATNKTSSVENIAPTKESNEQTYFKGSSYFDDGYDFGDVIKTIHYTAKDLERNLIKGGLSIVEGAADLATYMVSAGAKAIGQDEAAEAINKFGQKNLVEDYNLVNFTTAKGIYDNVTGKGDEYSQHIQDSSVLGDKSDNIAHGLGYIGGMVALQGVTVPWQVTSFVTSMGSEMTEAFDNNASYGEAFVSGLISGAAETGSEYMFGGLGRAIGKGALDDVLIGRITKGISNKVVKGLAQAGLKGVGEGVEEIVSGIGSTIGKKLTYMSDKDFSEIYSAKDMWDDFINGAIVSAISQAPGTVRSMKTGRDTVTGLTENETKVQNRMIEDAIKAKTEEKGSQLNRWEKGRIERQVKEAFENGEISMQTMRDALGENVDISKDGYLKNATIENYNRTQTFSYEKTDSEVRNKVYESAIRADMNNSRKTHTFVDYVAKLSEETGYQYEFATTKQLKKMGFKVKKGQIIDGVTTKDKVFINPQSPRALDYVLGHESTHVLEGTQEYNDLQDLVIDYAKGKGIYEARIKELEEDYKGLIDGEAKDQKIKNELTSNLVGELLFSDENFVKELSVKQPNVFKRIYERIKHLFKMATAGSEQAKQIEKIKKQFEKAYRARANNPITQQDSKGRNTRYSVAKEPKQLASTEMLRTTEPDAYQYESEDVKESFLKMKAGTQYSVSTYNEKDHKFKMPISSGGNISYARIDGKGSAGKNTPQYTGKEILEWALGNNPKGKEILSFMDDMAKFMKDQEVTFTYIGLNDVNNARIRKGADGKIVISAMTKNGEYPVNFDFTQICKKREALSKFIDELCSRKGRMGADTMVEEVSLSPKNIFKINKLLSDYGYETQCLGCFVEAKRFNIKEWAESFVNKWNGVVDSINPNAAYFNFTDGSKTAENISMDEIGVIEDTLKKYNLDKTLKGKDKANQMQAEIADILENGLTERHFQLMAQSRDESAEGYKKSNKVSEKKEAYFRNLTGVSQKDIDYLKKHKIVGSSMLNNLEKIETLVESGEIFQKKLRISDLITPEGIAKIKSLSGEMAGILSGHYGSGTPKFAQGFAPYNNEIEFLPDKVGKQTLAQYLYNIGGLRTQSFSDFKIENVFDYLQMVSALTARELPAHAYTKEIAFAELFGKCGMKINLSVMFDIAMDYNGKTYQNLEEMKQELSEEEIQVLKDHAGLSRVPKDLSAQERAAIEKNYGIYKDEYGEWMYIVGDKERSDRVFNENVKNLMAQGMSEAQARKEAYRPFVQSIGFREAVELQNREGYTSNIGIIGVGYSKSHILMMLQDNNIRYVIPYHSSGLPSEIKTATHIEMATDYTNVQNTLETKVVDAEGNEVTYSLKDALSRNKGDVKKTYNEYMKWIEDNGYKLITSKAEAGHGGFKLYETLKKNNNDPRKTANDYIAYCMKKNWLPVFHEFCTNENYYKLVYDFNVIDNVTGEFAPQQNVDFVLPNNFKQIVTKYMQEQNEYKSKLAGVFEDVLNEIYEATNFKNEKKEINLPSFSLSKDSEGNQLSYEQREFFKDSKAIDRSGNLQVVYHGTRNEFTVFDKSKIGSATDTGDYGAGFYFDKDKAWASTYGGDTDSAKAYYLNITNPLKLEYGQDCLTIKKLFDENGIEYNFKTERGGNLISAQSFIAMYAYENGSVWEKGIRNDIEGKKAFTKVLQSLGYDGIIVNGTEHIVFEPNQIKLINNIKPTENDDIRYSISKNKAIIPSEAPLTNMYNVKSEDVMKTNASELLDGIAPVNMEGVKYAQSNVDADDDEAKIAQLVQKQIDNRPEGQSTYSKLVQELVNKGRGIDEVANQTGNKKLTYLYDKMLTAEGQAQYIIGNAQVDINGNKIGKSLNEIWKPIEDSGLVEPFSYYMLHSHNIDRFREGKPVFGDTVTDKDSLKAVADYDQKYPQFKAWKDDFNKWNKNQLQNMVDADLTSEEVQELLNNMYQNYTYIQRDIHRKKDYDITSSNVRVKNPLKRATGGNSDIINLKVAMAEQTLEVTKAINRNMVAAELFRTLKATGDLKWTYPQKEYKLLDKNTKGEYSMTAFVGGKPVTFEIPEAVYNSFAPSKYNLDLGKITDVSRKILGIQRSLITVDNPLFIVTNFFKDLGDAPFNSRYAKTFFQNYVRAAKEIATKGDIYQKYMALGGSQNTYYDYRDGFIPQKNGIVSRFIEKVRAVNEAVEQMPRLAEFMSTLQAGGTEVEAMYNAAEITTNFKRGGDLTKAVNRNFANFLNASVQGLSKQVRNVTGQKGFKGYVNLLCKAAIYGVLPSVLNHLLLDDDEDYQELSSYVKDSYFLFKTSEGNFIRLPKGRVMSILGSAARKTLEYADGNENAFEGLGAYAIGNLAPNNPLEENMLAAFIQAKNNTTWYREDLVPSRLQDELPKNQYDESTDLISKFIGDKLNISPIKLNYILNQTTGAVGDFLLPPLTPEVEGEGGLLAPVKDKFTANSTFDNKNPGEFFSTKEKLVAIANDSESTTEDKLKAKYMNNVSSELSELYAEKREIQNSDLVDSEKYKAVKEIQDNINRITRNALESYENVDVYNNYATVGDKHYRFYNGEWTIVKGENLEKQNQACKQFNITPSEYYNRKEQYDYGVANPEKYALITSITDYDSYQQYKDVINDIKGDDRKEQVIAYVNSLDLNIAQKAMLIRMTYKSFKSYNQYIYNYVEGLNISDEKKDMILEQLGL